MYARKLGERTLTFGVSGLLVRNSLVMYDHQTNSLWSHLTGEALDGPLAGEQLRLIASTQASWATWRREHPDTLTLAFDPALVGDPYRTYYRSPQLGVDHDQANFVVDPRLGPKEKVIGLRLDGQVKAYSLNTLAKDRVVNDLVGDVPVVVVFDGTTESGAVFRRDPAGKVLVFRPGRAALALVDESGSIWDGLIGKAMSGPLSGTVLEQVPITYGFWFAWSDFYPETDLFT